MGRLLVFNVSSVEEAIDIIKNIHRELLNFKISKIVFLVDTSAMDFWKLIEDRLQKETFWNEVKNRMSVTTNYVTRYTGTLLINNNQYSVSSVNEILTLYSKLKIEPKRTHILSVPDERDIEKLKERLIIEAGIPITIVGNLSEVSLDKLIQEEEEMEKAYLKEIRTTSKGIHLVYVAILVALMYFLIKNIGPRFGSERAINELIKGMGENIKNTGINISVDLDRKKIILEDVLFESGSICIRKNMKDYLTKISPEVEELLNRRRNVFLYIEGHADSTVVKGIVKNVCEGRVYYYTDNYQLSVMRAIEVRNILVSNFKDKNLARKVVASGMGNLEPADPLRPYAEVNRRVELRFIIP